MKRIVLFLVTVIVLSPFIYSKKLYADEYYEFFQIMYASDLNYFHMSRIGIYNKGSFIWPLGSKNVWKKHIENLKILEKKYGLYVLDGAYGYYDNKEMRYTIDASHKTDIKIKFDKIIRPPGPVGHKQPYKSNPQLEINFDAKKVVAFHLDIRDDKDYSIDEVSVNDMDGTVVLNVCAAWFDKKYMRKCIDTTFYDLSSKSKIFDDRAIIAAMNKN